MGRRREVLGDRSSGVQEVFEDGRWVLATISIHGKPLGAKRKRHNDHRRYRRVFDRQAHIVMAEEVLGKPLPLGAVVHHFDPNDKYTSRGALVICQDQAYHALLERRTRALRECGNASYVKCRFCKKYDDPAKMLPKEQPEPRRGTTWTRYDHYQFKYKCVTREFWEANHKKHNLPTARTEGIWEAIGEHRVRCILCGLETTSRAHPRASHGKMHVRRGEAEARTEPKIHPKAKFATRTVFYPVGVTAPGRRAPSE